jgi:hypothetical protein
MLSAVIDEETARSGVAGFAAGLFRDLLAGQDPRGLIGKGALCATGGEEASDGGHLAR